MTLLDGMGTIFIAGVLLSREGIVGIISKWFKKPLRAVFRRWLEPSGGVHGNAPDRRVWGGWKSE